MLGYNEQKLNSYPNLHTIISLYRYFSNRALKELCFLQLQFLFAGKRPGKATSGFERKGTKFDIIVRVS